MTNEEIHTQLKKIRSAKAIKPGEFYLDCDEHPCLCMESAGEGYDAYLCGISLLDGSAPRVCSIKNCTPLKMTFEQAIAWKENIVAERINAKLLAQTPVT